jgi:hypothetical protein
MLGGWHLWGAEAEAVLLVDPLESAPPARGVRLDPELAAWSVDGWLPREGAGRAEHAPLGPFDRIGLEALGLPSLDAEGRPVMREALREALLSGRLQAYRIETKLGHWGHFDEAEAPAPKETKPAKAETTWIAIRLQDDAKPPKPVPFKRYRVTLPDRSVREGMLDANGYARIDGIDPGECMVAFPDFHGEDWRPA